MGIISKRYTNLEFKFQTKFEFKTKKKKNKIEKEMEGGSLTAARPARLRGPASPSNRVGLARPQTPRAPNGWPSSPSWPR